MITNMIYIFSRKELYINYIYQYKPSASGHLQQSYQSDR